MLERKAGHFRTSMTEGEKSMGVWKCWSVGVWEGGQVSQTPTPPYSHTPYGRAGQIYRFVLRGCCVSLLGAFIQAAIDVSSLSSTFRPRPCSIFRRSLTFDHHEEMLDPTIVITSRNMSIINRSSFAALRDPEMRPSTVGIRRQTLRQEIASAGTFGREAQARLPYPSNAYQS